MIDSSTTISQKPYTLDQLDNCKIIEILTYQMPYISGEMKDTTALVFYPTTPKPKTGWKVIVWMHGTVGVSDCCAPSKNTLNKHFKLTAQTILAKGYVIVAPDYEGLGAPGIHPYLHLKSEALSAIYAINSIKITFPKDFQGEWMVIGQSQGGQASLGTAEYANDDSYFKGAIAGAPASNLQMLGENVLPEVFTKLYLSEQKASIPLNECNSIHSFATILSYIAFMGVGITAIHPHYNYLQLFHPTAQHIAQEAAGSNGENGLCLAALRDLFKEDIIQFLQSSRNANLMDYKGVNEESFKNDPVLVEFFINSQPGTKKLDKPILLIQGEKDTNVPSIATKKLAEDLKRLGSQNVSLILVPDASHTEAIIWENKTLISFIQQHMPIE